MSECESLCSRSPCRQGGEESSARSPTPSPSSGLTVSARPGRVALRPWMCPGVKRSGYSIVHTAHDLNGAAGTDRPASLHSTTTAPPYSTTTLARTRVTTHEPDLFCTCAWGRPQSVTRTASFARTYSNMPTFALRDGSHQGEILRLRPASRRGDLCDPPPPGLPRF